MSTETAVIENIVPSESAQVPQEAQTEQVAAEGQEGEAKTEAPAKPEKTPEQREIDRLRRGIDRKTRQLAEARAHLTQQPIARDNRAVDTDSEALSLTRAQLRELVNAEAEKLAPTLREQATEVERRSSVVQSLTDKWGKQPASDPTQFANKFDELAADLSDAFDGLQDRSGKPKPAIEAVFEADEPAMVIEWLADPDNADEAERISKLSAVQAGKAIAKLEAKLSTQPRKDKPQPSKAPAPLESMRGQGSVSGAPDPSNTKAWIQWRNEQERKGL